MRNFLTAICLVASVGAAQAQDWVMGVGYADFGHSEADDDPTIGFELHAQPFLERMNFSMGLAGGIEATTSGDVFVGIGVSGVFEMTEHWFIEGSILPGYYDASSSRNDLGSDFEIRSLMGVGYTFDSGDRLSVAASHISNASTASDNPGLNGIQLRLRHPF